MENRVFVWNNIEVPMDVDEPQYEYVEEKQEDNVSLDLSVRTQSPCSENSYLGHEVQHNTVSEKIPTHGNDISVAQHKRVFKCPHCTFWASTASRFHVHIVGHLNKKPFECSLCAYRSNWRWDITKHIKLKSVRDPAHETAKVLMTDETGRRNYTKYNKYLTEINVSGDHNETSGGSGTRQKLHDSPSQVLPCKTELPKLSRTPNSGDFSPLLKNLRPPPALKAADGTFFAKISSEKKRPSTEAKKTLWQCKKCNFRDASREKLLAHVKGHYQQSGTSSGNCGLGDSAGSPEIDEASVGGGLSRGQAPFRCGHCHQRHCRLKHSGDIRVVIGTKNGGPEKLEVDEQLEEPDHVDLPQTGTFKCKQCPFSNNDNDEFEQHLARHSPKTDSVTKCHICHYYVSQREELHVHLKLHGINEPEDYLAKREKSTTGDGEVTKRYKCSTCPYVTNSKSQYSYHKQFHKPRGGQYTCVACGYNVSKRHLLHQHLKVHGLNASQKPINDVIDLDEISDEIEEVPQIFVNNIDSQNFPDIPLVWVSKNDKFSKMYKCRFCPHVNLRKVNIQEHEKMHGVREKNPNSNRISEIEHRCPDCNYVCNNAGVLSSHSKVHQGLYGTIHCLVDTSKTDEEQIRELSQFINLQTGTSIETIHLEDDDQASMDFVEQEQVETTNDGVLYFCDKCPARFLKKDEFTIHLRFHDVRLFYKCEYCTYNARQKPHLLAHNNIHSDEYQSRTKTLKSMYCTHPDHPQPNVYVSANQNGELIWLVDENATKSFPDMETEPECSIVLNKTMKSNLNVPLSGTELFMQKNEAQLKVRNDLARSSEVFTATMRNDPQFGSLMNGNPDFIYPTSLKNGRMKEKRYKCHKCPSAFEKREQYKIHLSLHGSKQRYKCGHCDYSVKYYANYVQHLKKHKMNADAQAAKNPIDFSEEFDETEDESLSPSKSLSPNNVPTSVRQTLIIEQQRNSCLTSNIKETEEKKLFTCENCPYSNHRKDAVDNHLKRHISVSGLSSNFTCAHCDYSVPQLHFLRDHTKWHFSPNKLSQPEGYMICNKIKLTSRRIEDSDIKIEGDDVKGNEDEMQDVKMEENQESLIFEDKGEEDENRFEPLLNGDVTQCLNNNDGEKLFVNPETGEMVDKNNSKTNATPPTSSVDVVNVPLEENLDSQVASDN